MTESFIHNVGIDRIETSLNGYKKLISFYWGCQAYHNSQVFLDFSKLKWIDGNMCALFMAILYKLNKENNLVFAIDEKNYSYLQKQFNILFMNGFFRDIMDMPSSKSAVVLTRFNKDEDQPFIYYIEKELFGNEGMVIEKEKKKVMIDNFLEIFVNVQLHARTNEPIFACGQFFPAQKKLHFTLVDLGVGYLLPIEEHTKGKTCTAENAIKWALSGKSTKPDAPGGIGLQDIHNYCKETKGILNIVTGDAYWISDDTVVYTVPEFCGTVINLIFNCDKKPNKILH